MAERMFPPPYHPLGHSRGSSGDGLLVDCSFIRSSRDEGREGPIRVEGLTTRGEIGQRVPLLLLTAQQYRQHRRDKATPPRTLGAKTDFEPQHRAA